MSGAQSFWDRRRAGVAAEAEAEVAALETEALAQEHAALNDLSDEELLEELGLPDPATLKMGDDFSSFMKAAVPDHLRRRALRILWRSNPVLANVDMLVDYGEDFTDAATVIENMQTTYQVGKGMLKHIQEMARQAEERETPSVPEQSDEVDEGLEADEQHLADLDQETSDVVGEIFEFEAAQDEVEITPSPRRMKFRIEETA